MDDEVKVEYIRYGFSEATLLGGENALRYDIDACKQRFEKLCRDALSEAFPDAAIDILVDIDLRTQVNGISDSPEVDAVEQICTTVWQSYRWAIDRVWLDPVRAHSRFGVPVSVIRWACNAGYIEEAEKSDGHWQFPQQSFLDAMINPAFGACEEALALKMTSDGRLAFDQCHSYDELAIGTGRIAIGTTLLIVLKEGLERPPWFTKDNTCLLVSVDSTTINLQVEHFVDADLAVLMDSKWSYETLAASVLAQSSRYQWVKCDPQNFLRRGRTRIDGLLFTFNLNHDPSKGLYETIAAALDEVSEMARDAEIELAGGPSWKTAYEKNEALFCQEILGPLLRRMGFLDVRYSHGVNEFGKDFTFSEITKFHELRHGDLQAKAGNIRGGVNSEIDELLGQVRDAFENPYFVLGDDNSRHISTFVIAISGKFTGNAEVKIRNKVPKGLTGSVHFLDRERILGLISRYWSQTR